MMFRRRQRKKKAEECSPDNAKSADSLDKVLDGDIAESSNRSFKRGRSVSMDAYYFSSNGGSEMKGLPCDVRKSLIALDKVLEGFEDDSKKTNRRHSAPVIRTILGKFGIKKNRSRNLPSDARKSVEVLDKVLNEYDDVIIVALKKKKRSSSASNLIPKCNEDVRRSLEILDNVLAEFDDHDAFSSSDSILVNGDEEESLLSHAHQEKERWEDENGNSLHKSNLSSYQCSTNGHVSSEIQSLDSSTDGTTSQNTSFVDDPRRCSAPPVPKRSPGTRLSNRGRHFFPKGEEEDETSQDNTSYHSLSSLQLPNKNGEQSHKAVREGRRKVALSVPTPGTSSPVDDNAQISNRLRHGKIRDEYPSLEFYLVRNGEDEDAADDDVFISPPQRNVNSKTAICQVCGTNLDHSSIFVTAGYRGIRQLPMDPTKLSSHDEAHLRRMRLDRKFAKVKLLLKTNQVTGLDKPPPAFKPPQPPQTRIPDKPPRTSESNRDRANTSQELNQATKNRLPSKPSMQERPHVESRKETLDCVSKEQETTTKPPSGLSSCVRCERENSNSLSDHHSPSTKGPPTENTESDETPIDKKLLPADVLCKNCINKGWSFRTTESLSPSPGPLKRPPLGLSYSMEDDLSPGIKEISGDGQNDSLLSSPKSSPVAHLSTFSHSASSLGDGSSQSELDFSNSMDSGKVPLTNIRSRTLPTDLKLGPSPFYCAVEGQHVNGTDTRLGVSETEAVRSSSAPPPPQDIGHWKRDKNGLSKKEKQNKNDADSSRQAEEEEVTTEAKPKKRSVWKSILRRK